ncbi:hypothetical protein F0L68_09885 [Solihabitans fulvus]|uniref:S-adenosyl methyltransferase n=1 Tax=Solihabitans fulvus TaxID=1892852 RepID=A0A5B2XI04_9PSEU|nr:SAM-dependent methyltransferase [Solihabitans fulvus]KAA2263468.1 hypothetical protein F0L68_09885 [Solihabitans fulvus]
MAERPTWSPETVDVDRPNAARMYDYFLGGSHNFAVDREAARNAAQAFPGMAAILRTNRTFLRRSVRYLAEQGVDQFLDLGSGIPTVGNVHEIARDANVVYVDVEPIAVAHAQTILDDMPRTLAVQADLRSPEAILSSPEVRALIDFDRPVGVLMVAVLHFVPERDDPAGIIARYRDALAPGSHLVVSHGTQEGLSAAERADFEAVKSIYDRTASPVTVRTPADIASWFDGFELVEPGVVRLSEWRPDGDTEWTPWFAGVGRKP